MVDEKSRGVLKISCVNGWRLNSFLVDLTMRSCKCPIPERVRVEVNLAKVVRAE